MAVTAILVTQGEQALGYAGLHGGSWNRLRGRRKRLSPAVAALDRRREEERSRRGRGRDRGGWR